MKSSGECIIKVDASVYSKIEKIALDTHMSVQELTDMLFRFWAESWDESLREARHE